jgi:hypothetical protein
MQAEKEIRSFTKKQHVQIAYKPRSLQSQTVAQLLSSYRHTSVFITIST